MSLASSPQPPREPRVLSTPENNNGASPPSYTSPKTVVGRALGNELHPDSHKAVSGQTPQRRPSKDGVGMALTDTPISTAPSSPQM
jgi:6-phosphofructo-2-kinase